MRTLAWFCGGFSAAILLSQLLPPDIPRLALLALPAAGLLSAALFPRGLRARALILSLAFLLGFARNAASCAYQEQRSAAYLTGDYRYAEILIDRFPTASGNRWRIDGSIADGGPRAALFGDRTLTELVPGQKISCELRFYPASDHDGAPLPQFTAQGIFLRAYLRSGGEVLASAPERSLRDVPQYARHALHETIDKMLSGDDAALLKALLTGDRSTLSVPAETALQEAGISHMMAISGMHLGFLMTLLMLVFRARRRLVLVAAVPILGFYVLLTGMQPSAIRAFIMLLLPLIAFLLEREADGPTTVLFALALILAGNPYTAGAPGAQLSFASVAGLMLFSPRIYAFLSGGAEPVFPLRALYASLSASAGVLITTTPLTLLHFRSLALLAPLGNLLCLPAAEGAFLSGILGVAVTALLPALAPAAAIVPRALLRWILFAASHIAHIPFHRVSLAFPGLALWLFAAYLTISVLFFLRDRLGKRRAALPIGLLFISLGLCLAWGTQPADTALHTCVVDVGQGSCTILGQGSRFCMVDCGSESGGPVAAGNAREALSAMRGTELTCLILTHYDLDHINGVETLLQLLPVRELILPDVEDDAGGRKMIEEIAEDSGVRIRYLNEKAPLLLGDALVYLYPPLGDQGDNERGIAVRASYGGYDVLITGDMDQETERQLIERYPVSAIECLVAGHHGSRYSTGEALLEAAAPKTVCISCGYNHYGHPAAEVLERLKDFGCSIHRTDEEGSVFLSSRH